MPTLFECQYPDALRAAEDAMIARRRAAAEVPPEQTRVGLALSGGGIRSATFSLGFLQGLARAGFLPRIDLLSTVSGGGYIGAFLGALFARQPAKRPATVAAIVGNQSSAEVLWLRDNGRYLAPNGGGDQLLAAATISRNWAAIAVVMATLVMTIFLAAHTLRVVLRDDIVTLAPLTAIGDFVRSFEPWRGIYWSPFLIPPLVVTVLAAVPCGWAYWLGRVQKRANAWAWTTSIGVGLFAYLRPLGRSIVEPYVPVMQLLTVLTILTIAIAAGLSMTSRSGENGPSSDRIFRNHAARALTGCLLVVAALLALGLVDTVGQSFYMFARTGFPTKSVTVTAAAIAALITAVQKISSLLDANRQGTRVKLPVALVAGIASIVVVTVLSGTLSAVSHGIARGWAGPWYTTPPGQQVAVALSQPEQHIVVEQTDNGRIAMLPPSQPNAAAFWTVVFAVLALFVGHTMSFVNLSALSNMYAARLSRAYVGASNPRRQQGAARSLTAEVEGDDLKMSAYAPHAAGGPLHVINVTLNETVAGESQIEYRDRKGLPMAVGPAGISVGVRHHATWSATNPDALTPIRATEDGGGERGFHVWSNNDTVTPERLGLSGWIAVSGAAISPGLGARTSLSLSLLLGLANVRLGYWWNSDSQRKAQGGAAPKPLLWLKRAFARVLPVQSALLQEFLAQFDGPHQQYWFLSDGGHFENTACYELLRRRVPLIIVCDDGADPEYSFEDLANLVRTARLDFAADVELVDWKNVGAAIGSLSELRRRASHRGSDEDGGRIDLGVRLSTAHMTIARVRYTQPDALSVVVWIKPTVTGDEPMDVLQYAAAHPDFPQQPTSDQFFDEAQWESYRKLGEHIAGHLFDGIDLDVLYEEVARMVR